jgi:hypothetical protein
MVPNGTIIGLRRFIVDTHNLVIVPTIFGIIENVDGEVIAPKSCLKDLMAKPLDN